MVILIQLQTGKFYVTQLMDFGDSKLWNMFTFKEEIVFCV